MRLFAKIKRGSKICNSSINSSRQANLLNLKKQQFYSNILIFKLFNRTQVVVFSFLFPFPFQNAEHLFK